MDTADHRSGVDARNSARMTECRVQIAIALAPFVSGDENIARIHGQFLLTLIFSDVFMKKRKFGKTEVTGNPRAQDIQGCYCCIRSAFTFLLSPYL